MSMRNSLGVGTQSVCTTAVQQSSERDTKQMQVCESTRSKLASPCGEIHQLMAICFDSVFAPSIKLKIFEFFV